MRLHGVHLKRQVTIRRLDEEYVVHVVVPAIVLGELRA